MDTHLFFGASTGRTATMQLANYLNAQARCTCVHERKFRHRETSGEQTLQLLTLEICTKYETPVKAQDILSAKFVVSIGKSCAFESSSTALEGEDEARGACPTDEKEMTRLEDSLQRLGSEW